ncbi:MAG: transporter substrate-binding domain-containing protein [Lachnospiraceae bacterium]|nr:transporter substrate-binding domain-containing protein [Lachnospiraceae bacterium]
MKKTTKVAALVLAAAMMMTACGGNADQAADTGAAADATNADAANTDNAVNTDDAASTDNEAAAGAEQSASITKTEGVITFGTNAEFPPFEFVAGSGVIDQYDGIDMAIAKQIAEDNGMTAAVENMEFDSLLIALQNGQIDAAIAGMTVTEERLESVDFSTPYYTATQVMIVKEDSDIAAAADMADKKICVVQGYTGEICVQDLGYPYEAFKKGTEAVMELVNGKCDVVVIDSATAQKYVSDNEGLKIVEDSATFESEEYAIAVRKGNTELLDMINKAVEAKLADGTISDLGVKYTEETTAE